MEEFALHSAGFWAPVLQIVAVDLLLGADNAIVIALACRSLPPHRRRGGVFWGTAAAIGLRTLLTVFALTLLGIPFLKLTGAALLLWIGVKLMLPHSEEAGLTIAASDRLLDAIRTIVVADAVMSLDNVLAVAAAARGSVVSIVIGLSLSIPIMVWASRHVLRLIERFPLIAVLGGGLLGWIALGMAISDAAVRDWIAANAAGAGRMAPALGAAAVMAVGTLLARHRTRRAVARVNQARRERAP